MLSGSQGDASNKRAPTLALQDLLTLAVFLEKRALSVSEDASTTNGVTNGHTNSHGVHTNSIFMFPNTSSPLSRTINAKDQALGYGYMDLDLLDVVDPSPPLLPTMEIIESIMASLIEQDLLHGFISHSSHRFAITGAKTVGALQVGFPRVWDVISGRADGEVPGWVREKKGPNLGLGGGKFGPGMVVNLSGARPAGAAPE